jgi:crotonobetainyl-CoA:carnitine CoA-transferase CaiB-like acyl-CoA transferase
MAGPLADIRVLDVSRSVAGAWCSRVLADLGAEVILIEPRSGHPLREAGPLLEDGTSVTGTYVLANKRAAAMDLEDKRAYRYFLDLVRHSDVVVTSDAPSALEARRLTYDALSLRRRDLIHVSITPHGLTGELAEAPGNDLTAFARSGWAAVNGMADREPLKGSGWQASYCAGAMGAAAAVSALTHRDRHEGEGQLIDVSEVEVMASVGSPAILMSQYHGQSRGRKAAIDITTGPVPVADGYFALTISRAHFWRDAMNLLGLTDLAEDERYEAGWYRQQHKEEYVGRVQERMAGWTRMDLFDELAVRRVIAGPVLELSELAANEHLRERGFWTTAEDDPDGLEYPGAPFKMSETPWALTRRVPRIGEHTLDVLRRIANVTDDHLLFLLDHGIVGALEDSGAASPSAKSSTGATSERGTRADEVAS